MIKKELIKLDSDFTDRDSCLSYLINKAESLHLLKDKDKYREAVEEREKTMPTSLGFLVAIPHGKSDAVNSPFVGILRTKKEFKWDENSENPVRLVFLIGVPEVNAGNLHLQFLSQISKKLINDNFRKTLLTAKTSDEIFELMNEVK